MNYLYIYKDRETDKVSRIDTQESLTNNGKITQFEIDKRIAEYNLEEHESYVLKKEVYDEVYEAIKFLLGKDEYVTTKTINTIHNDCEELNDTLEDIESNISHMRYRIENLVERIKEQFKIED